MEPDRGLELEAEWPARQVEKEPLEPLAALQEQHGEALEAVVEPLEPQLEQPKPLGPLEPLELLELDDQHIESDPVAAGQIEHQECYQPRRLDCIAASAPQGLEWHYRHT